MLLIYIYSAGRYYIFWIHNRCFLSVRIYIWAIAVCVYFVTILVYAFNRHLKCACYIKHLYTQNYVCTKNVMYQIIHADII